MAEIKKRVITPGVTLADKHTTIKKNVVAAPALFTKENYKWMAIGGIIIMLGMFLLSGGKNENPNAFDYKVVYSTTRVTIAPILIILGLLVEIYAIFRKPAATANTP